MKPEGGARALKAYLRHMEQVEANIRFMSIEPLWFDAASVFEEWLQTHDRLPFEWVIIGAASNGRTIFQPKHEWVQNLINIFDQQGIPVFFKGNLIWTPWRDQFPISVNNMQANY